MAANPAAANGISMDAAVAAVFIREGCIFKGKEEQKSNNRATVCLWPQSFWEASTCCSLILRVEISQIFNVMNILINLFTVLPPLYTHTFVFWTDS